MMKNKTLFRLIMIGAILSGLAASLSGCRKLIELKPSNTSLNGSNIFKDTANITAVLLYGYADFASVSGGTSYAVNASILPALSADEVLHIGVSNQASQINYDAFSSNGIPVDDPSIKQQWIDRYANIYRLNSIIEGINNNSSSAIPASYKNKTIAEARFLRALIYFHLVNFWGDVPLITTTDVNTNSGLSRTGSNAIYDQMVADLQFAETNLPSNFTSGGDRTRATTWAAKALLARVYLYRKQWQNAEAEATSVINSGVISLSNDLSKVFTTKSTEAILQFYNNTNGYTQYAQQILPGGSVPNYYLTPQLQQAFEPGDARKTNWTGTVTYQGTVYTYPAKYKSLTPGANTEYLTVLRLAEQYLVRAEARAQQNNLDGAKADVNMIRNRAGLGATTASTQAGILAAITQENRIEFNCELGHRWFDLKRANTVDAVLGAIKPGWKPTAALYPIPQTELAANLNLKQNPGY